LTYLENRYNKIEFYFFYFLNHMKRRRVDILVPERLHQSLTNYCEANDQTKTEVILLSLKTYLWLI